MITLYKHQKVAISHMRLNDAFAIFADQGTGKTIPTLWRIAELLGSGKARNALVVCPKAVVGSWQRDCEKFDDMSKQEFSKLTVTTYDLVWRRKEFYEGQWDIIVLDEAHKIKSRTSKRSKALLSMALRAKYRYELTGTPISNGQLENVWSEFAFLFPAPPYRGHARCEVFGSYYDFLNRYAYLNQWHQPYKYRNVDELQQIITEHSYRVTKAECLDLPDKLPDEILQVEIKDRKRYRQLHKDSTIAEWDILAQNGLARMTKLRQFCSGWVTDDDGTAHEITNEKLTALQDFLQGHGSRKLAIFCEFHRSIEQVCGLLTKMGIDHIVLDGHTKDKSCWRQFQSDPSLQVIVCQYQSANAGIDLFASDTMLFYEPCLSSNIMEQSRDRIHRIGQSRPCSYYYILTKGSIEMAIYDALQNYADFGKKLFEQYLYEYTKGAKV